ncbi:hypothetical protein PEBR_27544 [Penicillium brasilianum]|uniref:DDE-1 domain-containing protein n=1 Tax=Penicillium brasilianum TaxID=104259 RepID=A0A1S9RUZ2_PENBI|nr:hypothetical protein PEBR_27544 [Penicillium brasilianum]
MQNSVSLSAKMPPLPKRSNKGISDAQKKALRAFASDTHPRPSQRTCVEWFKSQFDRLIDRATVSKILSSKYDYLDTGLASVHMKALRTICGHYQKEDIYNMDETGLYWRRMLNGGLSTQNQAGRTQDKARITIVVATNATGSDRMPLWLIGIAKTPRALRKINTRAIGCVWRWNKKAWMRGDIMGEWLRAFYKHIGKQRRVLLLMDNFSAYLSALDYAPPPSNIKVLFFPNCFEKSTIICPSTNETPEPESLELRPLYQSLIERFPSGGDTQEVMSLDDFLNPSDENDVAEPDLSDIIADFSTDGHGDGAQDDEYISGPPVDVPSSTEAINSIQTAILWAQHQEGTTEQDIRRLEDIERMPQYAELNAAVTSAIDRDDAFKAKIQYLARDEQHRLVKPYYLHFNYESDIPPTNTSPDDRIVHIRNARNLQIPSREMLLQKGFTQLHLDCSLTPEEYCDDKKVEEVLYPKYKSAARHLFPNAARIEVLEHAVSKRPDRLKIQHFGILTYENQVRKRHPLWLSESLERHELNTNQPSDYVHIGT